MEDAYGETIISYDEVPYVSNSPTQMSDSHVATEGTSILAADQTAITSGADVAATAANHSDHESELAKLREEIAELKKTNAAKDAELEQSRKLVGTQEKSAEESLNALQKQGKKMEAAKKELALAKKELAEHQEKSAAEIEELTKKVQTLGADLKKTRQSNKGIRKQNEKLKEQLAKATEEQPAPKREPEENAAPAAEAKEESAESPENDVEGDSAEDDGGEDAPSEEK
ncbi:MAG: hypothetical protein AB8B91_02355 [Rubripirellula sp.]